MDTITPAMIEEMAESFAQTTKTAEEKEVVAQLLTVVVVLCLADLETRTEAASAFAQLLLKMNNGKEAADAKP